MTFNQRIKILVGAAAAASLIATGFGSTTAEAARSHQSPPMKWDNVTNKSAAPLGLTGFGTE